MASAAVASPVNPLIDIHSSKTTFEQLKEKKVYAADAYPREPLKLSGALDHLEYFDSTPIIGREYTNASIKELLNAPNRDELLRDLAITISQRGVVFFRNQSDLTTEDQKVLVQKLGELTGKPKESTLHIHPIVNATHEDGTGGSDNEISKISTDFAKLYRRPEVDRIENRRQSHAPAWHSDITFEAAPSDYSTLQIKEKPTTGGDTLWASGYEVYDRFSPAYQKFLEHLTATYAQPGFNRVSERGGFKVYSQPRGSPLNVGEELLSVHPVVRTNPVTGWKSIYAVGSHVAKINNLTKSESDHLLKEFVRLISENHDLQVRFRWNKDDVAIWDNRSVYHSATYDLYENDRRSGNRAVSIGEVPYLDPNSKSRREALGETDQIPLRNDY